MRLFTRLLLALWMAQALQLVVATWGGVHSSWFLLFLVLQVVTFPGQLLARLVVASPEPSAPIVVATFVGHVVVAAAGALIWSEVAAYRHRQRRG